MNKKINFIGIGVNKAGTTWLYYCLRQLPDFSLPPVKELCYFDRSSEYPSPNNLEISSLKKRLRNVKWTIGALMTIAKPVVKLNFKLVKWYYKFYFSNYNDDWYLSLFSSFKGYTGSITPSYSILKEEDILRMYKIAPEAKLILILRNPIDRAWSQYRFDSQFIKNYDIRKVTISKIIKFMNSDHQNLRCDYINTIKNYSNIFPKNQILICFYDAIKDNPLQLLKEVVKFIGGNPENVEKYCDVMQKVSVSRKIDMPIEVYTFLKEKYYSEIKQLAEEYGGYCNKWYVEINNRSDYIENEPLLPTIALNESLKRYKISLATLLVSCVDLTEFLFPFPTILS